jgi:hypothetical protein
VGKNPNRHRQPSVIATVPPSGPRFAADPTAYKSAKPVWSFGWMDFDGPWGWGAVSGGELITLQQRLAGYEQSTWGAIEQMKGCHPMAPSDVCDEAQQRLSEIGRDTIDSLFQLRVTTAGRLWGVRDQNVYWVLWWDPEHTVYPMNVADN